MRPEARRFLFQALGADWKAAVSRRGWRVLRICGRSEARVVTVKTPTEEALRA